MSDHLTVTHPADDDNLRQRSGMPDADRAAATILAWLSPPPARSDA